MALVNQAVADEIATLVARHRYAVEDSRDAVKAAEAASAKNNEEIKKAAAERIKQAAEQTQEAAKEAEQRAASGKARNDWAGQRQDESNEISYGFDDAEEESARPSAAAAAPAAPAPPVPPKPAPRRLPVEEEFDEGYDEDHSWLR